MEEQIVQEVTAGEAGVMTLTEEEILAIQIELNEIINAFEPDPYQATPTTQYVTAKYNEAHVGEELNGDTVEYILGYSPQPQEETVVEPVA